MWVSVSDAEKYLSSLDDSGPIGDLFSLSVFWRMAVYAEGYTADPSWPDLLVRSTAAGSDLSLLDEIQGEHGTADFTLALFGKFFHTNLFFDPSASNIVAVRSLLTREVIEGRVRFPLRFGRLLYDRFNDGSDATRAEHLLPHHVASLLKDTPQGTYQVHRFVTGPLGLLESNENRFFPPSLSLPLWHCSDTGCGSMHHVDLIPPRIGVVRAFESIWKCLSDEVGPESDWIGPLTKLRRTKESREGRRYIDLPVVLWDCLSSGERKAIVAAAFRSQQSEPLRKVLGTTSQYKQLAKASPESIAAELDDSSQVQLLLTLRDPELVAMIDGAAKRDVFRFSLGEKRRARHGIVAYSQDLKSDLSALGLRSAPRDPPTNLISSILRAYKALRLEDELQWRLRTSGSGVPAEALANFVRREGPERTIEELVLCSGAVTSRVCEELWLRVDSMRDDQDAGVARLMWKFGFDPPQFDDAIPRFKQRLTEFKSAILAAGAVLGEDDRERIRGAGVNLFVSVEGFIDSAISYVTWLLSSDHFMDTKFMFSAKGARAAVGRVLGESLGAGAEVVTWSQVGENSLGTLLRYLAAARAWVNGLPTKDRTPVVRPDVDLPHYAGERRRPFPFLHTELWADSDPSALKAYAGRFGDVADLLLRSELASIRNGIDHNRVEDQFPKADAMLACAARIEEAIARAESERLTPKAYWVYRVVTDRFGLREYVLQDQTGRSLILYGPALAMGLNDIVTDSPLIVGPDRLLGLPNSSLVFGILEQSEFTESWSGYPRRRFFAGAHRKASTQMADGDASS